ncbi:ubiquitin carboxyl-terminal hydrolase CYLD-like, partial [Anneissia japonica]|uniref:ubiquitin carboxyl-terminal hydrolase CYLD-like n=1 Tax=Anneissia japonica TaxID=1529436 RepID=UPI001425A06B
RYCSAATDGTFGEKRYFQTAPRRALFMPVSKCKPDARFSAPTENFGAEQRPDYFVFDSPSVTEITIPPMQSKQHDYGAMGIQGDLNSCYLDSTIFSMFAFVDVFDELLHRPGNENDLKEYTEVQRVLKEDIVYPLRKNGIVKAENIKKLRELLDALGTTAGMRDQEKDPEEFLTTLLQEVLKSDPLFKIRVHGTKAAQEMNFYQMFMERDDTLKGTPNVQTLLEQSFLNTDIKFIEIPSCFIVQMPRFGKGYKLYNRILPTLELDITHMLEDFPRPCVVCGRLSYLECRDCSSAKLGGEQITAYCHSCYDRVHKKPQNQTHGEPRLLSVPEHFPKELDEEEERKELHTEVMELFAVVCIETSHYVAFVKAGEKADSQWLFFDSMADRIGDFDGYNIPKITPLPDFQSWIENPKAYEHISDRELKEPLRRLLCDAYMCFYRSTTVCY